MIDAALPRATDRLLLRRFAAGDVARFQSYRRDPVVGRYQGWSAMEDDEARAFIAAMSSAPIGVPGEWVQIAVADLSTGALAGDIGLCVRDEPGGTAEVGFTMAPASQGRGLATEAVREAFTLLFGGTDIERVECITDARNAPSIRLLERIGMRLHHTREVEFKGEACTERVYVMARSDWGGISGA
ncbi:MAG TPA: GNAT family N-acetyltransferase [Casimicrobiaceae bacterium]|nr:GNAT family N-acetyltransferase [Casimicrobiaceae bacterium]